ncbi:OmpA family protein [Candidatus Peregrinibacteria bacterium]|nr:OmpA family protein [Candidatus Peregrinibacteria bacterium]
MTNLDNNLLALLKKSIKDNLATINGLDVESVMKHINTKKLDTLKKETIDKQKPTVIVWGSASMEGGFETNKRIAKARAESAKRQLEKKGYKVEARWAIQGLGERIDSAASYRDHEGKMLKEWNEKVSPDSKVADIKEIYAKLKEIASCTKKEQAFLNKYFIAGRRVAMQVEYPKKSSDTKIAMKFEETNRANV